MTSASSKRSCTQRGKYFHAFRPTDDCGSGCTILLTKDFDILRFITNLSHFEIDSGKRISRHLFHIFEDLCFITTPVRGEPSRRCG